MLNDGIHILNLWNEVRVMCGIRRGDVCDQFGLPQFCGALGRLEGGFLLGRPLQPMSAIVTVQSMTIFWFDLQIQSALGCKMTYPDDFLCIHMHTDIFFHSRYSIYLFKEHKQP